MFVVSDVFFKKMMLSKRVLRRGLCVAGLGVMGLMAGCGNHNTSHQGQQAEETASSTKSDTQEAKQEPNATDGRTQTVAITALVDHPSLEDIRHGVIDELAEQGHQEGKNLNIHFQSAQGNMATVGQISRQFVADNPDVIVTITTPSAQSMLSATKEIPIVYTAVSDPVRAKLIDENNKPTQPNVTGLSSQLPLEPQIDLIQKIKPTVKNIGFVYSAGEANSVSVRDELKKILPKRGLTLIDIPANRPTDIAMATKSLDGRADVIFTSLDNNVASAFEAMAAAANELKIPIIASDEFSVRRGATAALGVNDYDFGRTTGQMVAKILDGSPVNTLEPQVMNKLTLYVSPQHAKNQAVTLPTDVMAQAINVDETPSSKH